MTTALVAIAIIAMAIASALPWAWRYSGSTQRFYGPTELPESAPLIVVGSAAAAIYLGIRVTSTRFRALWTLLLVPIVMLAVIAVPMPTRSDMLGGGVAALVAAFCCALAALADLIAGSETQARGAASRGVIARRVPPPPPPPLSSAGSPRTSSPAAPPVASRSTPVQAPAPQPTASRPAPSPQTGPAPSAVPTPTIVTRTSDSSAIPLRDDFADRGERAWSKPELVRLDTLYRNGRNVRDVALSMRVDSKDVAARLARDRLGAQGRTLEDRSQPRHGHTYEHWEYQLMDRWPSVPFAEIVKQLQRDQLGVGWRMLDRGIPRRG